jgi:hypothetical protein
MARESIAGGLVKAAVRRTWTRLMDRVGGKFVAGFADTSSDAPDAHYKPKRNLYAQMQAEEAAAKTAEGDEGGSA